MGGAEPRAAPRAWRAPDLPRSEHRGRLARQSGLCLALALLALLEPVTLFVNSRMWTWWVSRSSSAPVSRSDPNTPVHSSNGRLLVTMVEPRSYRWLKTSNSSSAPVVDRGT